MSRLFPICANICLTAAVSSAVDVRISEIENKADYFFARGQIDGALSNQGHIIDTLVSTNLHSDWKWIDANRLGAGTDETAILVVPQVLGRTNMPPQLFIMMRDRVSANGDMADRDHDGSPNVYEINNDTNPYVADFENAPKVAVPPDCDYSVFTNALWSSAPYSIIEIAGEMYFSQSIDLPGWPLLITGPTNGYAVIHSGADIGVFMVNRRQTDHTLIRNVYLTMDRKSSFQAGFWIGGNLPWTDEAAGASFENVRLRMYNPGTWYYGWHMYGVTDTPVVISNCTISAAGATDVLPVYVYGDSQVVVTNGLDLVNMPGAPSTGDYTWTGYSLTKQYDTEKDSDGDRISDHDEVRVYGTDPYLKDSDGDRINDWEEINHGSNPTNQDVCCFSLTVSATNDFSNVGRLRLALFDAATSNRVSEIAELTNRVETATFHCIADGSRKPVLRVWTATEEQYATISYSVKTHDNTAAVPSSSIRRLYDADNDGIPDVWEVDHGLSPSNADDAMFDPDRDGLINLHEYWAGTEPLTPDGSNTVLSVCSRSVDDRIKNSDVCLPINVYENYPSNGMDGIFLKNTNCWSYGIDFSCASMWHDGPAYNSDCHPTNTTVTAITPRHVIYAHHFGYAMNTNLLYCFRGEDGVIYTNRLSRFVGIGNDIGVGLLETDLPASVHPAKFLPDDFAEYLGNGAYLPVVTVEQNECSVIHDLVSFTDWSNPSELMRTRSSTVGQRGLYSKSFIGGDSSSPRFLVVGNQVVLLGTLWKGGGGACCHANLFKSSIERTVNSLCPGYQLEVIDLSSFRKLGTQGGTDE